MDLMRSIVSAMDALLVYWDIPRPTASQTGAVKNAADFIEVSYAALRDMEPQVREYVADAWNDIVVNDLQRMTVRRLALSCRDMMKASVKFEKGWCRNEVSAFSLFEDEWCARKYVALCHERLENNHELLEAVAKGCLPQHSSDLRSAGKARIFEKYFVGVSDEALEYFTKFAQHLEPRVKWLGKRDEAVIFAEEFGLTAKDMNKSFLIPSRSGAHRDLSLSGDAPSYDKTAYPIWKILEKYREYDKHR